jgi:hypothetical protein
MRGLDRAERLARFPMDLRHFMAKNVVIAPFLINANRDELRCYATLIVGALLGGQSAHRRRKEKTQKRNGSSPQRERQLNY